MLFSLNKDISSITSVTGCECVSIPELYFVVRDCQEFFYEGFFFSNIKCHFVEFKLFTVPISVQINWGFSQLQSGKELEWKFELATGKAHCRTVGSQGTSLLFNEYSVI